MFKLKSLFRKKKIPNSYEAVRGFVSEISKTLNENETAYLNADLNTIIGRSKDAYRNTSVGRGAINQLTRYIITDGLKMQPTIDHVNLGITKELAKGYEDTIKKKFEYWASSKDCDNRRRFNFYELQKKICTMLIRDGDVLATTPIKKRGVKGIQLTLKVISNSNLIKNVDGGIECDNDGEIKNYLFNTPDGEKKVPYISSDGRINVLHALIANDAEANRGEPLLTPILWTIDKKKEYQKNELLSSIVQSLFTVFIKRAPDNESLLNSKASTTNPNENDPIELKAGNVMELEHGQEINTVNSNRPYSNYDKFIESLLGDIAMALGIPKEILKKEFNSSYSASRGALLDFQNVTNEIKGTIINSILNEIYSEWLYFMVIKGEINLQNYLGNEENIYYYSKCNWLGSPKLQIDKVKELNGIKLERELGLTTGEKSAQDYNGTSYSDNIIKQGEENIARNKYRPQEEEDTV